MYDFIILMFIFILENSIDCQTIGHIYNLTFTSKAG